MGGSGEGANPEQLFAIGYAPASIPPARVCPQEKADVSDSAVGARVSIGNLETAASALP